MMKEIGGKYVLVNGTQDERVVCMTDVVSI